MYRKISFIVLYPRINANHGEYLYVSVPQSRVTLREFTFASFRCMLALLPPLEPQRCCVRVETFSRKPTGPLAMILNAGPIVARC